jgi:hypothetical protein
MSSSSNAPVLGDAVRPDGTLKDASEIVWSYDADDTIPFPPSASEADSLSRRCAPAMTVAGARRSTRTHRPSQRVLDAAASSSSAGSASHSSAKRKASSVVTGRRITCKVIIDVDDVVEDHSNDGDYLAGHSDDGAIMEPAEDDGATTEPAEDDYEIIKAMADVDNRVRPLLSLSCMLFSLTTGNQLQTSRRTRSRCAPHFPSRQGIQASRYRQGSERPLVHSLSVSTFVSSSFILLLTHLKGERLGQS